MADRTQLRDRYELREILGKGGMGIVYRAWDTLMKREVALKTVLDVDNPLALDLFFREWGVLAAMVHPNVISIYDIGEFEHEGTKRPFFVMPLLPGASLDRMIREGSPRLTVPRVVDMMAQASRGLQAAHELGLVHRDVKSSNIFVLDDDSVKLIDFGIARLAATSSKTSLKGTLSYIAPEQLQMKPPTPLSDQYSLAVVCYEALTRRLPFSGATDAETVEAILHQTPPPVSELNPGVSDPLSQVIHKAMAKNPWHRFPSVREFGDCLLKALRNEPIEYFDDSKIRPRLERARRNAEQGEHEFALEILAELESEGYLDQEIVLLRRQLEQPLRRKRISALLEAARRFHQAQEFALALRKIQEALDLDAGDPDALALKAVVEKQRRTQAIHQWLEIARRHLDNKAFGQAQEALDKVLKVKPDDTEALRLAAELRRRQQELARIREQKAQIYREAVAAWERGEVTGALSKLDLLAGLEGESPEADTSFVRAFQSLYNQVRSEHDSLKNQYAEARRLLAEDNFDAALAISRQVLAKYPNHALFQALEYDIAERRSQKLSAAIAETDRRLEEEPDLDRRVAILEEALKAYPGEKHFEQCLRLVRDKRDLIHSIVAKAQFYEERQQYAEALDQWQIIRSIHESYPGLLFEMERLAKKREQQAHKAAKAKWVEQIDRLLESGDYARAKETAAAALEEFAADPELAELEKLAQKHQERSEQAFQLLEDARQRLESGQQADAIGLLRQAWKLDPRNSVVRAVLANTLLQEASRALESDLAGAEKLLQELLALEPSHPAALSLSNQIADRRREEFLSWCLAQARRLQTAGDLDGALAVVVHGLESHPNESRLRQLQAALERARSETRPAPTAPEMTARAPSTPLVTVVPPPGGSDTETKPLLAPQPAALSEAVPHPRVQSPAKGWAAVSDLLNRRWAGVPKTLPRRWIYAGALAFAGVWLAIVLIRFAGPGIGTSSPKQPAQHRVTVTTLPEAAEIRVGGKPCGISRCELLLAPGSYHVVAALPGYEEASATVEVPAKESGPVLLRLAPLTPALILTTNIEGAELSLDDAPPVKMAEPEVRLGVAEGNHTLRVTGGIAEVVLSFTVSRNAPPGLAAPVRARGADVTVVANSGAAARIFTSTPGARASIDGKAWGEVPPEGLAITGLAAGSHELVWSGAGGLTRRLLFDATQPPSLIVLLTADAALGALRLTTGEDDVSVLLNGELYRRKTQRGRLLIYLPPKQYRVRVEKDGFEAPPEQTAEIRRGEEVRLNFAMKPLPPPAALLVRGGIAESEVLVDGRLVGVVGADGTLKVTGLSPGDHTVLIRRHGYRSRETVHTFAPGASLEVSGALPALLGRLRIVVTPADVPAALVLQREGDSEKRPVSASVLELPEGVYTVIASAPGYQNYGSTVKVVPNQTVTASILLEPVSAVAAAKAAPKEFGLGDWEKAGGWQRQGHALTRTGGGDVLLPRALGAGAIRFRIASPGWKRLEWLADYRDEKNYVLYRLDRSKLERVVLSQGKRAGAVKSDHKLRLGDAVDVSVALSAGAIVTSIQAGAEWKLIDECPLRPGESSGRFGLRIPERAPIVLESFSFTPK